MLLARREDFEPQTPEEQVSALYNPPYNEYPFFQIRVDALKGRFAPNNQTLLIAGCGWGYMVEKCQIAGYDAFGCDASQYAVDKAKELFPSLAAKFFLTDCTNQASMRNLRRDALGTFNRRFSLLVTEDLFPCFTDGEITAALTQLRDACSANLLHIITPGLYEDENPTGDSRMNWKTPTQWKALVSPPDLVYDTHTQDVVP